MSNPAEEAKVLTPEESWRTIGATLESARSSMYLAGTTTILLLWGLIASLGYLTTYAIEELASGFADAHPWIGGPVWGVLAAAGMVGSAIIGARAGRALASAEAARSAGLRMFLFWLAVVAAAFLIPGAAGTWNESGSTEIGRVAVGIIALGHVLFGIMYRPIIAAVGVGIAAAFFIPSYLAGDLAPVVTAAATLAVVALATLWIRRSGVL